MLEQESKKENYLQLIKELISIFPGEVEQEFSRTPNSWMSCYAGNLDAIETYLNLAFKKKELPKNKYEELQDKMEALKLKIHPLRNKYCEKDSKMPDEIKNDLLKSVGIFQP